jgi:LacI family transcriptional regulator
VVGFDDIFAASLCSPGLTTLGGPYAEVGRAAVELLMDAVGPVRSVTEGTQLTLPSELVIRGSTGQRPA